jgi:hypothetical protein
MSALALLLLLGACQGGAQSTSGSSPSAGYPQGLEPRNSVPYMRP